MLGSYMVKYKSDEKVKLKKKIKFVVLSYLLKTSVLMKKACFYKMQLYKSEQKINNTNNNTLQLHWPRVSGVVI